MTPTIALMIWLSLPMWIGAVYFNVRKHNPEPKQVALLNGTMLWLMYGGFLVLA